ncbi:MAG TPA: hypothetical protein VL326_01045 [Kofleriaceae bacterium]|jgi:hypothetical protein|nr:hypothetical protein [Kofleriaceae bacterium]
MSWRNLSIALALVCLFQWWRACNRPAPSTETQAECPAEAAQPTHYASNTSWDSSSAQAARGHASNADEPAPEGPRLGQLKLPAWTLWLAPHPGENMLDYRDRMVPLAQTLLKPQRERVARSRDDLAKQIGLDAQQRAQLDGAVAEAATQIEDKVMNAFMSGDLNPATFKPMTGVTLARDVLDNVDQANRKFMQSLREDQKSKLASHPFDFADYLLFSARWEDALGVTN